MTNSLNAFSHGRTNALVILTRLAQRRGDTRLLVEEAFAGRLEEMVGRCCFCGCRTRSAIG